MNDKWFEQLYEVQKNIQRKLKNLDENQSLFNEVDMYAAATGAMVEIGEMLQCDTRWKEKTTGSKKEPVVNKQEFIKEWADVLIYLVNVLIYADVDVRDAELIVNKKQFENMKRFNLL